MSTEEIAKADVKQPGSGMAIASLVMGIASIVMVITSTVIEENMPMVFCGFFLGIASIIFSINSLIKIYKGLQRGKGYAVAGLVTGIVVIAFSLFPKLNCERPGARRISCISNLKQIGLAIRMYSQENKEQFPDKSGAEGLEMLRAGGYLENVKIYTCPSTKTVSKDGEKLTEENVSYVYVGGYNIESTPLDTAIAYDKPNNHKKYGNILFTDGHVQGYAGAKWMDNIKK